MTTQKQSPAIGDENSAGNLSTLDASKQAGDVVKPDPPSDREKSYHQNDGEAANGDAPNSKESDSADAENQSKAPGIHHRLVARRAARDGRRGSIEQLRERVYGPSDLSKYTLRQRLLIRAADLSFYFLIRLVCSTLRWEVRGDDHLDATFSNGRRAILTFWHTCIFGATWFWRKRGIVVMSSQSRDGEYIASFIKRFGYGAARGSSSRGGARALAIMAECLANGMDVAFTIDGPRGPAFEAKTGAVTLARHTEQVILPFHIAVRRHISLPSWDRLQIPLPFTRAAAFIAEPIYVPRDASSEEVASKQTALQSTLDRLREEAEAWRAIGR